MANGTPPAEPVTAAATLDGDAAPAEDTTLRVVDRDRYVVGDELSRGGLGRVLRGHDRALDRSVAIKQMLAHNPQLEARFAREARITARLQHPGIVPIYEAGRWPTGEPFYAMKLVTGRSLKDELAATTTFDERLALLPRLLAVVDAIAYAHSERVIHRDLKPANIMLGPFGEAYVVDWGLAKSLDGADDDLPITTGDADGLTRAGTVLGTPPYLAPEQARGERADERADVYALGAILYQLLTGAAPYDDVTGGALERIKAGPPRHVAELESDIPQDLVAIVDTAMARETAARYATAGELAADLHRFQTGQLVGAHRYTTSALLRRWLRRNARVVAIAALALVAVVATVAISFRRVVSERDDAQGARAAADVARQRAETEGAEKDRRTSELLLAEARHWLEVDPTVALAWLKRHASTNSPDAAQIREVAIDATSRGAALDLIHGFVALALAPDGTAIGTDADHRLATWRAGERITPIGPAIKAPIAVSHDGARIAFFDGKLELFDRTTRTTTAVVTDAPTAIEFVGATVAVADAGGVRLLAGPALAKPKLTIDTLVASPDGARLAGYAEHGIVVWTVATGELRELPSDQVKKVAFSPQGDRLAWAGLHTPIRWVDLSAPETAVHSIEVKTGTSALAFSHAGTQLAIGGEAGVRLADLGHGTARNLGKGPTDWVNIMIFAPGDRVLISGQSRGGPVMVWDLVANTSQKLLGHDVTLNVLALAADGTTLVSGDRGGMLRRWTIATPGSTLLVPASVDYPEIAPLPGGGLLTIASGKQVVLDDLAKPARVIGSASPVISHFALSKDRQIAAWTTASGVYIYRRGAASVGVLDPAGGRELAISPDGTQIAVGGMADGAIRLWTLGEHPTMKRYDGHTGDVYPLCFSLDGKHLASAADDQHVHIRDLVTGANEVLPAVGSTVETLVYGPDGELAIGRANGDMLVHGATDRALVGHASIVNLVVFLPNHRLASGANDGTARLWDLTTGSAIVLPHRGHVQALALVDDRRLATGNTVEEGADATIRIWDLATGALLSQWPAHIGSVYQLAPTLDHRALVSSGTELTVRVWPLEPAQPVAPGTRAWLETLTSVDLGPHDTVATP